MMVVIKLIVILLGAAFLLFGYWIRFRKKYHLINGFKADYQAGRKDERYAERVGMIEFVLGIVLLVIGILFIIFI